MSAIYCVCPFCQVRFDRNSIQAVKYGARRYAHQTCYPTGELVPMEQKPKKGSQLEEAKKEIKDNDYKVLCDYINDLFNGVVNWGLVGKQIKYYHDDLQYPYTTIQKILYYAYEVKKNDIKKAKGIGVVSQYYKDAKNYFFAIWQANQRNENIKVEEMKEHIVNIVSPDRQPIKKRNIFTFLDEEDML